jgi:predicted metal-binding membrane protein
VPTGAFLAGYLLVWATFSALATAWQWELHATALLSPRAASASPYLSGILLLVAGIYQWTPVKSACLKHCRSPLGFLMRSWRDGASGALRMGLQHGTYCVACCWFLMLLMFVLGAMNLLWMAALTAFVVLEKAAPGGRRIGQVAGLALIVWGAATLVLAF